MISSWDISAIMVTSNEGELFYFLLVSGKRVLPWVSMGCRSAVRWCDRNQPGKGTALLTRAPHLLKPLPLGPH